LNDEVSLPGRRVHSGAGRCSAAGQRGRVSCLFASCRAPHSYPRNPTPKCNCSHTFQVDVPAFLHTFDARRIKARAAAKAIPTVRRRRHRRRPLAPERMRRRRGRRALLARQAHVRQLGRDPPAGRPAAARATPRAACGRAASAAGRPRRVREQQQDVGRLDVAVHDGARPARVQGGDGGGGLGGDGEAGAPGERRGGGGGGGAAGGSPQGVVERAARAQLVHEAALADFIVAAAARR